MLVLLSDSRLYWNKKKIAFQVKLLVREICLWGRSNFLSKEGMLFFLQSIIWISYQKVLCEIANLPLVVNSV